MMIGEKKHAVEVNSRTHLEMDEIEELLELARKTDERSWCILTLAFNHGLRVSECAGGAPAIPGKTRPAIPPLTLSDIDIDTGPSESEGSRAASKRLRHLWSTVENLLYQTTPASKHTSWSESMMGRTFSSPAKKARYIGGL